MRDLAQRLVADMTPEQRRAMLHSIVGGADPSLLGASSPIGAMFDDPFRLPPPKVGPVPGKTRGFRVRLDLKGTKPPVWRRLELPGDLTLDRLHLVIQHAMGWSDAHLHHFRGGSDPRAGYFLTQYDIEEEGEEGVDEADVRLDQVVRKKGDKLWYDYDFGDDWEHVLAVEQVLESPPDSATLVAGKLACPPEDCGGVWGYTELAEWVRGGYDASAVPGPFESAEHAHEWLPIDWHPDEFDLAEAQQLLGRWLAPEVPVPDELLEIRRGLDFRGCGELSDLIATAAEIDGAGLVGGGSAGGAQEPAEEVAAAAVGPFVTLLDVVGGGVKLTSAGYLPPAVVSELAERTGVSRWWIGKLNREDQTYPIHQLRGAARNLGLVSVRKGVLAPTAAAKRAAGDPLALWRHIASRLPLGRTDFDTQAGWVSLAVVAAGTGVDRWDDAVRGILSDIGWRTSVDGRSALLRVDNPTLYVLEILAGRIQTGLARLAENAGEAPALVARTAIFHRADGGGVGGV